MTQLPPDAVEWIRSRPEAVQEAMRKFPPMAVVRATRPLMVPGPGETGVVVSYYENGLIGVQGTISPLAYEAARKEAQSEFAPTDQFKAQCSQDDLEVVEYGPITPDDIATVLNSLPPPTD